MRKAAMKKLKKIAFDIKKAIKKLAGKGYVVKGKCNRCGACCRHLALFLGREKIRDEEDFIKLKEAFPEYERFRIIGRHPSGILIFACSMVGENNLCRDYAHRPQICKAFPCEESFDFLNHMPEGCGYEAVPVKDFESFLKDEEKRR